MGHVLGFPSLYSCCWFQKCFSPLHRNYTFTTCNGRKGVMEQNAKSLNYNNVFCPSGSLGFDSNQEKLGWWSRSIWPLTKSSVTNHKKWIKEFQKRWATEYVLWFSWAERREAEKLAKNKCSCREGTVHVWCRFSNNQKGLKFPYRWTCHLMW